MSMQLRLRKMVGEDLGFASELFADTLEWSVTSIQEQMAGNYWQTAFQHPGSVWRIVEGELMAVTNSTAVPVTQWSRLGLVGFEQINGIDRVCEPVIAIQHGDRELGYGLRVAKMMRDFAWNELNARRIQSRVLADAPSRKLLEKLEFAMEGVSVGARYKNGEYVDVIHYALVRS